VCGAGGGGAAGGLSTGPDEAVPERAAVNLRR
jgi:hypothetical protein